MSEKAKHFFEEFVGQPADQFITLAQSGSSRINYIGEANKKKYIITENNFLRENKSFLYLSEVFSSLNLNTPKIHKVNPEETIYIQDFLGKETLSEIISKEKESDRVKKLIKDTLTKLFNLQEKSSNLVDYSKAFEYESYNDLPILHDLYYFKNFMVDVLELPYHKAKLLTEFKHITSHIDQLEPKGIMLRDFQSRNIMVDNDDRIGFIDYQSAMQGPLLYDVISLLYQAKANFSEDFKNEMIEDYINLFPPAKQEELNESFEPLLMMRLLQVLGAYGFRGLIQKKAHFIDSINQGINNIKTFTNQYKFLKDYPELSAIIKLLNDPKTKEKIKSLI